jgi:hypothetical protein
MEVMPRPVSKPQLSAYISLWIYIQSFQIYYPYATAQF